MAFALVRADVVLPYNTNLPRDVAINTFWFASNSLSNADIRSAWDTPLQSFYNDLGEDQADKIGALLSNVIQRNACRIEWYNGLTPGPPFHITSFTLVPTETTTTDLPLQIALVASFYSVLASSTGEILPRPSRSGRVFVGPWTILAVNPTQTSGTPTPAPGVVSDLAIAAATLAGNGASETSWWAVWSRKLNAASPITNGWVDNRWDTQRRRDEDATSRQVWELVP